MLSYSLVCPSPNSILAALKIVCISSWTDGLCFQRASTVQAAEDGLCAPVAQHRGLMKYLQANTWREPRRGTARTSSGFHARLCFSS